MIGAEDICQNLLKIDGFVIRFEPSKSSIYATPSPSPVEEFEIEFGLGNTCAISPSSLNLDNFSASNIFNLFNDADKFSKSLS